MRVSALQILVCTLVLALGVTTKAFAQEVGSKAPEFSLEVLQGENPGALANLQGKVVIIEFWATYCGWCKKTHPPLAKFAAQNAKDVVVLGITAQRKSRVLRYLRKTKTGLTIAHDPRGRVSRAYRAKVTPTLVLIDKDGVAHMWAEGGHSVKVVLRQAKALLK